MGKRAIAATLALLVNLALTLTSAPAGASVAQRGAEVDRPELQQALDAMTSSGASAALGGVRDEQGRWRGASGVAKLGTSRPAPVNGRFRAGSITKTFVATVVLQLAAERRLRLDDPVSRWLPGRVPGGDQITIRQLLNHTSGLFNFTEAIPLDGPEFLRDIRFRTFTPHELLRIAAAHPPNFPPGQGWSYSNTGYIVLGLIIEKVTGRSYGHEVHRRILRPLQLRHTYVPGTRTSIAGPHAHGYLPVGEGDDARLVDITRLNPSWAWAAGEIISTTADLNRFYAALLGGRLLPPAQLAEMQTTVPVEPGFGYGLGLYSLDLPCGERVWGHGGGIHGYVTVSLHSADNRRHATLSLNPLTGPIDGVEQFFLAEFCDSPETLQETRDLELLVKIRSVLWLSQNRARGFVQARGGVSAREAGAGMP